MVTEKQFQLFQSLYEEEATRRSALQERAKTYLSLTTLYSGFVIFVSEKLRPDSYLSKGVFVTTIAFMLIALSLTLLSMKVSAYQTASDPNDIIETFDDMPPTDTEFFEDRIADYTFACEANVKVNNSKALQLRFAGYALLLGIFFHACYFVIRTF